MSEMNQHINVSLTKIKPYTYSVTGLYTSEVSEDVYREIDGLHFHATKWNHIEKVLEKYTDDKSESFECFVFDVFEPFNIPNISIYYPKDFNSKIIERCFDGGDFNDSDYFLVKEVPRLYGNGLMVGNEKGYDERYTRDGTIIKIKMYDYGFNNKMFMYVPLRIFLMANFKKLNKEYPLTDHQGNVILNFLPKNILYIDYLTDYQRNEIAIKLLKTKFR